MYYCTQFPQTNSYVIHAKSDDDFKDTVPSSLISSLRIDRIRSSSEDCIRAYLSAIFAGALHPVSPKMSLVGPNGAGFDPEKAENFEDVRVNTSDQRGSDF